MREGSYFAPEVKSLGYVFKRRKFKKRYCVIRVKLPIVHVQLRNVLQKLLEQKGIYVLPRILQYMEALKMEDQSLENCIQGNFNYGLIARNVVETYWYRLEH